jgi:peptide/nickel transport system ATP-binding protein
MSAVPAAVPVLDVRGLTIGLPRGADRAHAIEDVSFCVNAGEIVALLGESGSGKSVIAQAVMGLLPTTLPVRSGEVLLNGENVLKVPTAQLRSLRATSMSMVFQEPMTALNPVLRCGDQLDELLTQHTQLSANERKVKVLDIMAQVKLPEPARLFDAFPHQLSGGQRQRIMIAMALLLEPKLLIADEPTTALDVTTQAEILKLIAQLQRERGTGVLFITHDMGVVAQIADRVVVLKRGQMVEQGDKMSVLTRPREAYTKMLLAAVPSMEPSQRVSIPTAQREPLSPVLKITQLAKTYVSKALLGAVRTVHAAQNVSLTLSSGETLGIVGESGSGKSTVARCVVRLIDPTSGEILLSGQPIHALTQRQLRPLRSKVQIVFQDPYRSLNPRQTVGAAICEGPMNFGLSKTQAVARAQQLMETVGLTRDALNRYPNEFSGGQRQRICIARALAMNPELLICDEAVSALDVSVQAQIIELLERIQAELRLALLFITHDLRVAAQICDRIVVMQNGHIVEQGATREVFLQPKALYTKTLLAAAPGRDFAFGGRGGTSLPPHS